MANTDQGEKKSSVRILMALSEPVEFNGETVSEISYRKATGRDMRKALNIGKVGDRYMALAVDLLEMPEAFFNLIPGNDFMAVTDVIDGFFAKPQKD